MLNEVTFVGFKGGRWPRSSLLQSDDRLFLGQNRSLLFEAKYLL